jgi:hypothetical protein
VVLKGDGKDSFLFEGDEAEILPLVLLYRVDFNLRTKSLQLPNWINEKFGVSCQNFLRFYTPPVSALLVFYL